jgi:hypothetical protein
MDRVGREWTVMQAIGTRVGIQTTEIQVGDPSDRDAVEAILELNSSGRHVAIQEYRAFRNIEHDARSRC